MADTPAVKDQQTTEQLKPRSAAWSRTGNGRRKASNRRKSCLNKRCARSA
jgi:hypothetical protein